MYNKLIRPYHDEFYYSEKNYGNSFIKLYEASRILKKITEPWNYFETNPKKLKKYFYELPTLVNFGLTEKTKRSYLTDYVSKTLKKNSLYNDPLSKKILHNDLLNWEFFTHSRINHYKNKNYNLDSLKENWSFLQFIKSNELDQFDNILEKESLSTELYYLEDNPIKDKLSYLTWENFCVNINEIMLNAKNIYLLDTLEYLENFLFTDVNFYSIENFIEHYYTNIFELNKNDFILDSEFPNLFPNHGKIPALDFLNSKGFNISTNSFISAFYFTNTLPRFSKFESIFSKPAGYSIESTYMIKSYIEWIDLPLIDARYYVEVDNKKPLDKNWEPLSRSDNLDQILQKNSNIYQYISESIIGDDANQVTLKDLTDLKFLATELMGGLMKRFFIV